VVDLPAGASEAPLSSINVPNFGEFQALTEIDFTDVRRVSIDLPPMDDAWFAAASSTIARYAPGPSESAGRGVSCSGRRLDGSEPHFYVM
jgi:hypothetical protein